ncbi:MAG TPA: fibronectin type III domain-containing protein, partial [Saprospiraceae bacterium]|nr:fibronectin type III domain-containing protein [Saprospiraceae bacterium]
MKPLNYPKSLYCIFCSLCFYFLFNISLEAKVYNHACDISLLAPTKPNLRLPSDGSIFQILGTQLVWDGNSEATFYKLSVATDAQMTNIIYSNNNITTTSFVVPVLNYNTTYYWNVIAANASISSPVSNTWSFKTMASNPKAVTSHPRLWFTQADLPKLQSWAVPSNPVYVALQVALATAITNYNTV